MSSAASTTYHRLDAATLALIAFTVVVWASAFPAIRAGLQCVMVANAFYGTRFRATLEPSTYRLLRRLGFHGIAITDSLSLVREAPVERWARQAVRAGADLLLFTSPAQARRAVAALVPLARRGELDAHVARVLRYRAELSRVRR